MCRRCCCVTQHCWCMKGGLTVEFVTLLSLLVAFGFQLCCQHMWPCSLWHGIVGLFSARMICLGMLWCRIRNAQLRVLPDHGVRCVLACWGQQAVKWLIASACNQQPHCVERRHPCADLPAKSCCVLLPSYPVSQRHRKCELRCASWD